MYVEGRPGDGKNQMPGLSTPNVQTSEGLVPMPLWACAQVPSLVNLSGETSALPLK